MNLPCLAGTAKSWPEFEGTVERLHWMAQLSSMPPWRITEEFGPELAQAPDLTVVSTFAQNRTRALPVRVDPATVRLKLKSGQALTPLTPEEVRRWAQAAGATIPNVQILEPIEAKTGERRFAAAVFRLPPGAETSSAEAEMVVDLGPDGKIPVKARFF